MDTDLENVFMDTVLVEADVIMLGGDLQILLTYRTLRTILGEPDFTLRKNWIFRKICADFR